jgi:hypothetical protein
MATTNFASPREVCRLLTVLVLGLAAASGACAGSNPGDVTPTPFAGDGGFPVNVSFNPPNFDTSVSAADPPPAISGGTLVILPDGVTAVAGDPDRDTIAVVNLTTNALTANIAL